MGTVLLHQCQENLILRNLSLSFWVNWVRSLRPKNWRMLRWLAPTSSSVLHSIVQQSGASSGRLHEGFADSVVARAFVAKPEDLATANPTLWDFVESDGLDPGPTTSSAFHKFKHSSNCTRDVNTNSLKHARNPSFSGDFLHAIALISTLPGRYTACLYLCNKILA